MTSMLHHVDLIVGDADRSIRFYAEHLGGRVIEDAVIDGTITSLVSARRTDHLRLVLMTFPDGIPSTIAGLAATIDALRWAGRRDEHAHENDREEIEL